MRPLSFITLTIAAILTVPIALWSVGLNPDWMLEVHLLACGVVVRLLVMSASLSRSVQEVAGVGLYGGGIGSLSAQIVLLSRYLDRIAELAEVPLALVSVGRERTSTITLQPLF